MPATDSPKSCDEVRAGPRRQQTKSCPKAHAYEPHPEHIWEKNPGWPLLCEGIPEVEDQPPCAGVNEADGKVCGEPAPALVRTRTAVVDAKVPLCVFHKRKHDNLAANRRSNKPDAKAS